MVKKKWKYWGKIHSIIKNEDAEKYMTWQKVTLIQMNVFGKQRLKKKAKWMGLDNKNSDKHRNSMLYNRIGKLKFCHSG